MNLGQLIQATNNLSDEDFEPNIVTEFLNDAVAKINIECETNFPFLDLNNSSEEYKGFPEKWQRVLLVPFAVARSKQKESSQFEYSDAYNQFFADLVEFKTRYQIPDEYKDAEMASTFTIDYANSGYRW